MDGDRKYRQRGYYDSDREVNRSERPRPQGPKLPIDVTGPRLPRLVQAVTAARCYNCATTLPADIDYRGNCPKCTAALHCCKQCAHFEPSTRFQCLKPIPGRIPVKDQANMCDLFKARVTVAREATQSQAVPNGLPARTIPEPRNPNDARAAFDNLFKK
jgi:hypothetical protein